MPEAELALSSPPPAAEAAVGTLRPVVDIDAELTGRGAGIRAAACSPPSNVGLAHDYLLVMRGAERTFAAIADAWPNADIYTTIYSRAGTGGRFADRQVHASRLQRLGVRQRGFRLLLPLYPRAVEGLPVQDCDLLISSSSAFAHGIRPSPGAVHVCYCHTPFRYAWHERETALAKAPAPLRHALPRQLGRIRQWDLEAAGRVTHYIANSRQVQDRIERIYDRESVVIHPPVEVDRFRPGEPLDYFLVVTELVAHKRIEVALEAAEVAGAPIKVVGTGPELGRLRARFPNAEFLGRVPDLELADLYAGARALLVPGVEEFGIAAVEAQASGRPVVATGAGGVLETIVDGETGVHLPAGGVDEFAEVLREVDFDRFRGDAIAGHAQAFSTARFRERMVAEIDRIWTKSQESEESVRVAPIRRRFETRTSSASVRSEEPSSPAELTLSTAPPDAGNELDALDRKGELADEAMDASVAAAPPYAFTGGSGRPDPETRRRDTVYRRLLAVADALALVLAFAVGVLLVDGLGPTPLAWLALPALIVTGKVLGLYDRDQHLIHKTTLDEIPKLFHLSVLAAFTFALAEPLLVQGEPGAAGLLAFVVILFLGLAVMRSIARRLALGYAPPERCVVLGDRDAADELAAKLAQGIGTTVEFVGHLDHSQFAGNGNGAQGRPADVGEFLVDNRIQRVVLAPGAEHRADMLALVGEIKSLGIRISVLPSVTLAGGISFELDRINGTTLLGVRGFEFNRSSQILKRGIDLALSGTALLALAPLMAVAAVAIKATSPGPVFYRQTRIGRHGKPFRMLKLRTMYENADALRAELRHLNEAGGGLFKIAEDPRVTRVGKLLRSFSLDEVPQLWNVLRGEMSLVGPRPLVVEEDRLIKGWHRQRLSLTPGMTGYWQVMGSARLPLDEMVKLDYAYVQNWSAWHDIQLLLRTIGFVAARRGL